jgi:NAD(P)-dependent dehydrogenase (short-subunit alcohol dehydrogenase family)
MQTVLITGGNTGLGFETAKQFLLASYAIIIACRNVEKAEEARNQLIKDTENNNISIVTLDLASFKSIRECANNLSMPIDVLICNAGVAYADLGHFTKDNIEETFGVNHLGHFLLTNLLLKKFSNNLKKVIVISSEVHNPASSKKFFPEPAISSIQALAFPNDAAINDKKKEASLRYVHSKLCNLWFTYEINRRLNATGRFDISVNAFNPGFIPDTNLARNNNAFTRFLMKNIMPHLHFLIKGIRTTVQSAKDILNLAQSKKITNKYFDGAKEANSSPLSYDKNWAKQLWEKSIEFTKLLPSENIFKQ